MPQGPSNVSRISRRTLTKGAAWSVPVLVGASQVAQAASSIPTCTYTVNMSAASPPTTIPGGLRFIGRAHGLFRRDLDFQCR